MSRVSAIALSLVFFSGSACALPPPGTRPVSPPAGDPRVAAGDVERERSRLQRLADERREGQKARVERVGRRLLSKMSNPPAIQFVIVDGDPSINAGATFGQVGVTSGMMQFLRDDDELASVLGHEIAHISQGHVTKGVLGGLALNVLAIVVESQAPGAGQAVGGIGQLFLNRFTQSQERDADAVGIRLAYQAGYDPRAQAAVMERLAVEVPQTMHDNFFATHPSSVERRLTAQQLAENLLAKGPPPGRAEAVAAGPTRADPDRMTREAPPLRRRTYVSSEAPAPPPESLSPECRRAATYLKMARDTRDPDERERLRERAIRYCPEIDR